MLHLPNEVLRLQEKKSKHEVAAFPAVLPDSVSVECSPSSTAQSFVLVQSLQYIVLEFAVNVHLITELVIRFNALFFLSTPSITAGI